MDYPTDAEIEELDDRFSTEGVPVLNWPTMAMSEWMSKNGAFPENFAASAEWFRNKFAALHPSVDFSNQPFAFLSVSARSISYQMKPPMVFGHRSINPIDHLAIQQNELERIFNKDPTSFWEMYYQAADCIDLFAGSENFHPTVPAARGILSVGFSHLEAIARQLVAGRVDASTSHAVCAAVETISKAVLTEQGQKDKQLRDLGHNIGKICKAITKEFAGPNDSEYLMVADTMPELVKSRHHPTALNMMETQNLYRKALFLSAEALRRTGHDPLYYKVDRDSTIPRRKW
jgi:hypothetical protein